MGSPAEAGLAAWHHAVRNMSEETLDAMLAEDVVFQSPVVHTPQRGRAITKLYLMAAFNVFPGDSDKSDDPGSSGKSGKSGAAGAAGAAGGAGSSGGSAEGKSGGKFRYVREVVGEHDAVLEFMTEMDGIEVNGVDMIRWNDDGKIVDFKVMVRPLKAMQKVHAQMGAMLEKLKQG